MKILIVDDDADILGMMSRLFTQRGHAVETWRGPFGVSAKALRTAPELILLDVMMPALDGIALSELLTCMELDPPPVIALWSADGDALDRAARETGLPVLSKHADPQEVIAWIEQLDVARRRP